MLNIKEIGGTRCITLDRPPVNALNQALLDDLTRAIKDGSQQQQAIVITGANNVFCAGLDTRQLATCSEGEKAALLEALNRLLKSVADSPVPIATAITGHCLGGGLLLAALCDYRTASPGEYKIGLPEVRLGLVLSKQVHTILARLTGEQLAQRMCVEGHFLTPVTAHRVGLLDTLEEAESVLGEALAWCERILSLPRQTTRATRAAIRAPLKRLYEPADRQ